MKTGLSKVLEVKIDIISYHECLHYHRFLEFEEFCQLSAKFLIEEDEEGMKRELKEAFRIYDKAGTNDSYILNTTFNYVYIRGKLKKII